MFSCPATSLLIVSPLLVRFVADFPQWDASISGFPLGSELAIQVHELTQSFHANRTKNVKTIGIFAKPSNLSMPDPVLRTNFPCSFLKKSIAIRLFWLIFTLHVAIVFCHIAIGRQIHLRPSSGGAVHA
jgi:hypothetical protein